MQLTDTIYQIQLSTAEADTIYLALSAAYRRVSNEIEEQLKSPDAEELRRLYNRREKIRTTLYNFCDITEHNFKEV